MRHAPVPGPRGRIAGRLDLDCDAGDAPAFARLASRLPAGALLVESKMARCRQTALALAGAGLVLPPPIVEPRLAEQDFGLWEGKTWAEIGPQPFWDDPVTSAPPGGESFANLCERTAAAILDLTHAHPGQDIIAIIHAGSIRAALALALGIAPAAALKLAVDPLSLTRLDHADGHWRIEAVNVTS